MTIYLIIATVFHLGRGIYEYWTLPTTKGPEGREEFTRSFLTSVSNFIVVSFLLFSIWLGAEFFVPIFTIAFVFTSAIKLRRQILSFMGFNKAISLIEFLLSILWMIGFFNSLMS